VVGVIKHLPGHGRALADSHQELPTVTADEAALEADLAPFRALAQAPIAMTGHIRFTAWDADLPATLSPFIIAEIIRGRIGFEGLLLTDDLDMAALNGPVPDRAAQALAAGCDLALNCWAKMDDMIGIAAACPVMRPDTAERLDLALARTWRLAADPARWAELTEKRDALLGLVAAAT